MIKTYLEGNKAIVEINGDIADVIIELGRTLENGVMAINEQFSTNDNIDGTLYATIKLAIDYFERDGYHIDTTAIGKALATDALSGKH